MWRWGRGWNALAVLVAALIVSACAGSALAAPELERQVPLDLKGRVGVIEKRLALRLGLFVDEHPGFLEARLLLGSDSTHVLEVLLREPDGVVRSRRPLDPAQVDSLRAIVQERVDTLAPEAGRNQEGRVWMLAGDALLGFGFYGWAVPVVFDMQSYQGAFGAFLVTSGLSYFVPFAATRNADITYAMANLGFYGQTRGIAHGVLLVDALDQGAGGDGRSIVGCALAMSLAEGALGTAWASASRMSPGRAATFVTGGDFGAAYGLCLTSVAGGFDGDDDAPAAALATFGGTAAGLAAAHVLASHRDYSYGDAGVMRVAGLVGGLFGASLSWLPEDTDPKATAAAFTAGSLAGLAIGDRVVRGAGFTGGQNVIAHFGAGAGSLVGLGLAFLSRRATDDDRSLGVMAALGAAGGWALTVSQMPRLRPAGAGIERASERVPDPEGPQLAWNVEPRRVGRRSDARLVPHLTLRARF